MLQKFFNHSFRTSSVLRYFGTFYQPFNFNSMKLYQLILISLFFCSSLQLLAQPANDDYTTATALTVQPQQCNDTTAGTLVDATDSGVATGCIADKTGIDVWYSAVVPESGELSVETTPAEGSDARMILTAFTLENNSLKSLACDDTYYYYSEVLIENQTAGTIIYFQVAEKLNVQNNGVGGHQAAFSICAWDSSNTPDNDVYTSATSLTVYENNCQTPVLGTLVNANFQELGPNCTDSGYISPDVWYSLVVPESGELSIQTSAADAGSTATGLRISSYSHTDGTLTIQNSCYEGSSDTIFPTLEMTGQTPGETLYFQILDEGISYNGSDDGYGFASRGTAAFQICAWDDATLITERPSPSLLSYYSNPMGNRLRVESPYDIQSLAVYDLMGREVLTKSPQKQKLTLDTYSLAPGVYLLNVQTAEGQQTVKLVKK